MYSPTSSHDHASSVFVNRLISLKKNMASTVELLKRSELKLKLFNKLSVHLQSCQCLVLYVKTLIILPEQCQAISSLVSAKKAILFFTR